MRTFLLITALSAVAVRGEERVLPACARSCHAKIIEAAPPAAPPKSSDDQKDSEGAPPPVVMKALVVSDSKLVREVTAALDREKQNRQEERFSPLQGGKIATLGPMQLGSWWTLDEGWTFLRLRKGPSPRQVEATEAMLKDLQELANIAEGRKAPPQPNVQKVSFRAADKLRPLTSVARE